MLLLDILNKLKNIQLINWIHIKLINWIHIKINNIDLCKLKKKK